MDYVLVNSILQLFMIKIEPFFSLFIDIKIYYIRITILNNNVISLCFHYLL
jgi:hypothetical protein